MALLWSVKREWTEIANRKHQAETMFFSSFFLRGIILTLPVRPEYRSPLTFAQTNLFPVCHSNLLSVISWPLYSTWCEIRNDASHTRLEPSRCKDMPCSEEEEKSQRRQLSLVCKFNPVVHKPRKLVLKFTRKLRQIGATKGVSEDKH